MSDGQVHSEYASGSVNYFRNRLHLDVWLSSKYAYDVFKERDRNSEKPVKELFLETLQLRLRNNFWEISKKNSTEKWFSLELFLASFVRNPEAIIRGVNFAIFTGKPCVGVPF